VPAGPLLSETSVKATDKVFHAVAKSKNRAVR
jgi:hypothetical protein